MQLMHTVSYVDIPGYVMAYNVSGQGINMDQKVINTCISISISNPSKSIKLKIWYVLIKLGNSSSVALNQ